MPSIDEPIANKAGAQPAGVKRFDAGGTLVDTDGDLTLLQVDANGALRVTGGGGGTEYTEDAAAAANPVGGAQILVRADTPASAVSTDGDNIARRGTAYGAAYSQIVTSSGAFVDSFGGGTEYTEDAAAAANPVGKANILVRTDTPASEVSTNGDNVAQRGTAYGAAFCQMLDSSGNFINSFGGGTQYTEGDVDASITGTAMMMEVAANTVQPVQGTVADGLLVNLGSNNDVVVSDGGGSITIDNSTLAVVGGGTEATAMRVTIASDSTGVVSVDDNGASLTIDNAALSVTGGGVEASALRVTIANDSTGVLSVDDNGGSLTVDGTVAISGSVAVTNAGTFVVQENGAALTALQLIDDTVATLGTTTYTEAATKGLIVSAVRRDADTTLVDTTNEIGPLQMNAAGQLKVEVFSGEALPVTMTSTTITGTVAVTQSGTWDEVGINDSGNSITVDNGGTFVVQENGAALTALQLIDDGIATTGSAITAKGMTACGTDGTNARALKTDTSGELQIDVLTLPASTNTLEVVGDAAHDAAIAGNPVRIAGRALTSDYTAVAAGDTADLITTLLGKLVTIPFANPANTWSYAAASGGITNTTGVTIKAAAGAGVRNYITCLSVINGHASTSTDVQIRDGASGTVLWRGFAQAAGGGVREVFSVPIRGSANTLLEVACGTTGSATYVNVQGFSAAE